MRSRLYPMKSGYVTRYRYDDTRIFLKFSIRYGCDTLFKNKFKIKYTNTRYTNITKIEKDNKLTIKLLKLSKQVTTTYLKLIKYYPKRIIITIQKKHHRYHPKNTWLSIHKEHHTLTFTI
jgi:hypothetical protein